MQAHVGTADLDFHLSLHLLDGETAEYYDAIIEGVRSLGLHTAVQGGRQVKWRWVGQYREVRLQVEFLCPVRSRAGHPETPVPGTPAEVNVGPGDQITALAVGYGHLVPEDTISVPHRVETASGAVTYEFPVAGLASWLCLKSDAIMRRNKPKDAYDVIWTLDALGPDDASRKVANSSLIDGSFAPELRTQLRLFIEDQFRDTASIGPSGYATFLEAYPGAAERLHALGTVNAFSEALSRRDVIE